MADYFEIDFLEVNTNKSGDAIGVRYTRHGLTYIHVVDGGYAATGEDLVRHINPGFPIWPALCWRESARFGLLSSSLRHPRWRLHGTPSG